MINPFQIAYHPHFHFVTVSWKELEGNRVYLLHPKMDFKHFIFTAAQGLRSFSRPENERTR